jgi:hypothetical protein
LPSIDKKRPSFVVGAFIVLLQPSLEDYTYLLEEIIKKSSPYGKDIYSVSGADETSISLLYAGRGIHFTHIHQKYAATSWKTEWVTPGEERAFHYFGKTKPWDMHVDEYPDLAIWWNIADMLCSENESIKNIIYPEYTINELDIAIAEYKLVKDIQKYIVQFNNGATADSKVATKVKATSAQVKSTSEQVKFTSAQVKFTSAQRPSNKTELWNNAIKLFKMLIKDVTLHFDHAYPICSQILITEYSRTDFVKNFTDGEFCMLKLPFDKLIKNIKQMITNRIKQKPRSIKIKILDREILCDDVRLNKCSKYQLCCDEAFANEDEAFATEAFATEAFATEAKDIKAHIKNKSYNTLAIALDVYEKKII